MEFKDLLGIPFKYGGRDKAGMDCYGLVVEVFRRLGINVEDPCIYSEKFATADYDAFEIHKTTNWREVVGALEPFDVLLFSENSGTTGTHCAVYLPGDRLLHALEKIGVAISPMRRFKRRFLKAYRWQG